MDVCMDVCFKCMEGREEGRGMFSACTSPQRVKVVCRTYVCTYQHMDVSEMPELPKKAIPHPSFLIPHPSQAMES